MIKMKLVCEKCNLAISGKLIHGMAMATWYENAAKAFKFEKTQTGYLCENCAQQKEK